MPLTPILDDDASPSALVVHARIGELVDRIAWCDSSVRRRKPGGVHQMRVTLRRLRSLLATFAPLYHEQTVATLRTELKWLAGEFDSARDAEVVRARLKHMATTLEQQEVAGRVDEELADIETDGVEQSVVALDSERYSELLRGMTTLVTQPPWTKEARQPADDLIRGRVRREWKRLRKRVQAADDAEDGPRLEALHEARKAVKRLRYGAETLKPLHGSKATRLARRAKRVQSDLGDLNDHAVAREMLLELAGKPGRGVRDAFVLGTLHADEESQWLEAEERYVESWEALTRKQNRRWLS